MSDRPPLTEHQKQVKAGQRKFCDRCSGRMAEGSGTVMKGGPGRLGYSKICGRCMQEGSPLKKLNPKKATHTGPFTVNAGTINAGGFKTLATAKKYAKGLYSRGLLFGRTLRIVDAAGHEVVAKDYNPMATKKKKKKARKPVAKNKSRKGGKPKTRKNSAATLLALLRRKATAKSRKRQRAAKARQAAIKKAAKKANPSRALKSKLGTMKPRKWYDTTLSGAKVKVQRRGQTLIVKPRAKRRR